MGAGAPLTFLKLPYHSQVPRRLSRLLKKAPGMAREKPTSPILASPSRDSSTFLRANGGAHAQHGDWNLGGMHVCRRLHERNAIGNRRWSPQHIHRLYTAISAPYGCRHLAHRPSFSSVGNPPWLQIQVGNPVPVQVPQPCRHLQRNTVSPVPPSKDTPSAVWQFGVHAACQVTCTTQVA